MKAEQIRINGAWEEAPGQNKNCMDQQNQKSKRDENFHNNIGLNDVCVIEDKSKGPGGKKYIWVVSGDTTGKKDFASKLKNSSYNDDGPAPADTAALSDAEKNQQLNNDSISKIYRNAQDKGAISKNTPFKNFVNWFNEDPGRALDLVNKAVGLGFSIDEQIKESKGKPKPVETTTTDAGDSAKLLGMPIPVAIGVGVGVIAILTVGGVLLYRIAAGGAESKGE